MTLRWLIASLHIAALAVSAAAIALRGRALRRAHTEDGVDAVLIADNWWGVGGLVLLATGLWRAFGGIEKGTTYYLHNPLFHAKLGLFVLIVALEVRPMMGLIRWRTARRRDGAMIDLSRAALFARISDVQLGLLFAIVFLATAIARGLGA